MSDGNGDQPGGVPAHWEICGDAKVGGPGHWLTRNGVEVFRGPWAACVDRILRDADDADTATTGTADWAVRRPVGEMRREEA